MINLDEEIYTNSNKKDTHNWKYQLLQNNKRKQKHIFLGKKQRKSSGLMYIDSKENVQKFYANSKRISTELEIFKKV